MNKYEIWRRVKDTEKKEPEECVCYVPKCETQPTTQFVRDEVHTYATCDRHLSELTVS